MRFSFIHAADLHIDSPLAALGRKNAEAAAFFASAGRRAVQALVDETIQSQAAFLIIAGDVFDGDWPDVSTGLFFMRELVRLERANVPVFMLRGNHDAESRMSRGLKWPGNVREFSTRKAETFELGELRAVLHGRGFPDRAVEEGFVAGYPSRRDGWLNIGVLHTSLDGRPGHAPYAPCSVTELKNFGYDYWALGHIHQREIVAHDPWIVYPGNLQGRSVRETGPKGAMRVTVDDGRVVSAEPLELAAACWAHVEIDVAGCEDLDAVYARIHEQLSNAHTQGDARPLAARLTLRGATALHDVLLARREHVEEQALGAAERVSHQCWIEKIRLETTTPARSADAVETKSLGLDALLDAAAADPDFATQFDAMVTEIRNKTPPELREAFNEEALGAGALSQAVRRYLSGVIETGDRS
jgi:DNA repair exonuclease SbcCD nuclease subunit